MMTSPKYYRTAGTSGIVYLVNKGKLPGTTSFCLFSIIIEVPKRHFVAVRLKTLPNTCTSSMSLFINNFKEMSMYRTCKEPYSDKIIYSSSNTMNIMSILFPTDPYLTITSNFTMFYLFFTTVAKDGKQSFPVVATSPTTGYVTSPGFGSKTSYPQHVNARYDLIVPSDHVVMTRFRLVDMYHNVSTNMKDVVTLSEVQYKKKLRVVAYISSQKPQPPRLSQNSLIIEMVSSIFDSTNFGFKMDFSFHPSSDAPVMYANGSLECSRPNYQLFRQHVHCDLVRHCSGSEDEGGHCFYSSKLCQGMVALGTKCYQPFTGKMISWYEASQACRRIGGNLVTIRSPEEMETVKNIFRYQGTWQYAFVGLQKTPHTLSKMYWSLWKWIDDIMAYNVVIKYTYTQSNQENMCALLDPRFPAYLRATTCNEKDELPYICEFEYKNKVVDKLENTPKAAATPDIAHKVNTLWSEYAITECPFGHVTFSFLSCEPSIKCGVHQHQALCSVLYTLPPDVADHSRSHGDAFKAGRNEQEEKPQDLSLSGGSPSEQGSPVNGRVNVTVAMFACVNSRITLPYTLVCDFVPHCPFLSNDEAFCTHHNRPKCSELTCASGQCFSREQECDEVKDCQDSSDEANCHKDPDKTSHVRAIHPLPTHTIVDFDGRGDFSQRPKNASQSCPETHFACLMGQSYCLPVYVRCNGVYDCPGREDERTCGRYMCPGFYRCRESRVCVHVVHMCDGWPQCPKRDDELYCGLTCPPGCLCQGLAVVCSVKFPAQKYPQTRYLDASGSNMKPEDLSHNTYLVWLSLAFCSVELVTHPTWPNMKYLDLSENHIHSVSMDSFLRDSNLQVLILAGNPVTVLVNSSVCATHGTVKFLDLSETKLQRFDSSSLSCFPQIAHLNFSYSRLNQITEKGFKSTPDLKIIDLTGNLVSRFPRDVFKTLNNLQSIWADNYKICCKATLPENFNEKFCFTTYDEISSCDDLLKSNLFRGCMWIFAALSVLGNLLCFLFKVLSKQKNRRSGFNIFVTNLTIADFLMGVYLVIVGVADEVYRGRYMWYDITWKTSTACTIAGFLSLLSSEMSAFTICLITLDRFIVLTFPFTTVRFKGWPAILTCSLVWAAGVLLASVPLFPMTSKWDFYGQTGICIPLPTTGKRFSGHDYAFGIMIILNFVLCLLIAAGQASIYRSVQANSMTSDSNKKSQDINIARRLITVAASDFLCWFPIGLLGLLSSNDVPVPSDVSVAMAIFVLPLNSALNPFLYTFNVVMEGRRKTREAQLIKFLESRIRSEQGRQQSACHCSRQKPDQA